MLKLLQLSKITRKSGHLEEEAVKWEAPSDLAPCSLKGLLLPRGKPHTPGTSLGVGILLSYPLGLCFELFDQKLGDLGLGPTGIPKNLGALGAAPSLRGLLAWALSANLL